MVQVLSYCFLYYGSNLSIMESPSIFCFNNCLLYFLLYYTWQFSNAIIWKRPSITLYSISLISTSLYFYIIVCLCIIIFLLLSTWIVTLLCLFSILWHIMQSHMLIRYLCEMISFFSFWLQYIYIRNNRLIDVFNEPLDLSQNERYDS